LTNYKKSYIITAWTSLSSIILGRYIDSFDKAVDILNEYIKTSHIDTITSYTVFNESDHAEYLDSNYVHDILILDKAEINKIIRINKINEITNGDN
jgi:hypothetical protein